MRRQNRKKLTVHRETLRNLSQSSLRTVVGATGESECVSYCISDTFPGNCPKTWNCDTNGCTSDGCPCSDTLLE